MIIRCLVENTSVDEKIGAEHGLSLYIESLGRKILFDSGQSDLILRNAEVMGVDLSDVDFMVLSHGHYDHGGGIKSFLSVNSKASVYMSRYAEGEYYNGTQKYIGLDKSIRDSGRVVYVEDEYQLSDGMTIYSCNNKEIVSPVSSYGLNKVSGDKFVPDDFLHEQYLQIDENGKKILISGCSHKGILNIEHWFKPDILIGGFHLVKLNPQDADDARILKDTAEQLMKYDTAYYTCHCTGVMQYDFLKEYMKDRIDYISAGTELEL